MPPVATRRPIIRIITTGEPEIQRELANRRAPKLTAAMRAADEAGAKTAQPIIAASAPRRTGATAASVQARGTWVGPTISYRIYPIKGTSRGVEPNPWVQRGITRARPAVRAARHRTLKALTDR